MSFRSSLAEVAGKSSYWILHNFFHGGSSFPGKITTQIDPKVLKHLGANYRVIIVTGTNGKTLTTAITTQVLKKKFNQILTNPSGSNMEQGIVTTFLEAKKPKTQKPVAVLEVDEANVVKVTKYIKPIAFVLTNIFRDQMDRYGEIYTTYKKIINGIKLAPKATIIANGDASIFNSVKLPNPKIYYGFKNHDESQDMKAKPNTDGVICPNCHNILHYHYISYSNLGDYFCPHCGYHRPELNYHLDQIDHLTPTSSTFEIDGHQLTIDIGGVYNIYNALAAYTVGRFMGVEPEAIQQAFQSNEHVFGRQEEINVNGKKVTIILVKNPVGLNQVIDMISTDKEPFSFIGLLNANYADGIDTSWIWDGDFERLPHMNIKKYITGGERYRDITFRLKVAGVNENIHTVQPDLEKVVDGIPSLPTKRVYILATYTAMLQVRKHLAEKGYIKGGF
ncbi:UDP-N-acetylmuramyl peptide synthase [Philodulcilactobacillus myokoensis]|uniref:Lipid II isoglutaminyl synthase (glutamine-hydrolyzing) subunit MurT n=1 Tax=Philodulcilactobacillus myokoensis TaxID=2929573 RepID=A0A9W6B1T5_9LACO|nr:Mur ligase family protein [Philodulcilactobacillus myokoensis]GLB47088.1 UDP-N-acetylmuramyl peptide synthase [Philodulcilactobacillus myokoensis]